MCVACGVCVCARTGCSSLNRMAKNKIKMSAVDLDMVYLQSGKEERQDGDQHPFKFPGKPSMDEAFPSPFSVSLVVILPSGVACSQRLHWYA